MKHKITIGFSDGSVEEFIVDNFCRYQCGAFEIPLTENEWVSFPLDKIDYIQGKHGDFE